MIPRVQKSHMCVHVNLLCRTERRKDVNGTRLLVSDCLFSSTEREEETWPCTFLARPLNIPKVFNSHKQLIHMSLKERLPSSVTANNLTLTTLIFLPLLPHTQHTHKIIAPVMISTSPQCCKCCNFNSLMLFFPPLISHYKSVPFLNRTKV